MACGADDGTGPSSDASSQVELTVIAQPPDGGSVTGGGRMAAGTTATVTATPSEEYRFVYWLDGGQTVSTSLSYSLVVDSDRTVTAEFSREFDIATVSEPGNGGTTEGGGKYIDGQVATLSATPAAGFRFDAWIQDTEVVTTQPTYQFAASSAAEFTARFALDTVRGAWSPGGTYSDWYFPEPGYGSLEWTFLSVKDPAATLSAKGLLHFYAYTFGVTNATGAVGGGYAGFQTNGIILGQFRGKVINFSIWGSNGGKSDGWINPTNSESGGWQIMYPYVWSEGGAYRFELREGPSGMDDLGKWWGLWVTDLGSGSTEFVGEQRVPAVIEGRDATLMQGHTAMFGEDLHWWRTLNGLEDYHCGEFEASAMAAVDVTANGGTVLPYEFTGFTNSGQPATGSNGHQSTNCAVTLYQDEDGGMQHNLGFWPDPAPRGR